MLSEDEIQSAIQKSVPDDFSDFEPSQNLSTVLWEENELKQGLRNILYKIALEFYLSLDISAPIKDIIITGSLANYNYTKVSDVDLHVLFDFSEIDENLDLVKNYMNAKKSIWNEKHNIKIKGHDVELYGQDVNEEHHSTGVYSIMSDKWLTVPKRESAKLDLPAVQRKASALMKMIDNLLEKDDPSIKKIDALKKKIKNMRQSGLERSGEYSAENLAFKVLRNTGYIERLYDRAVKEFDKSLSVENEIHTEVSQVDLVRKFVRESINGRVRSRR
tara:strand:+ start:2328 stop:3152 length:825 start_codon:yes stop_codon:yes gene_type:complete